ncbi:MAG TPA: hypothetical protein VFB55_13370 [Verrucomicrobiae bacterium]|nr:hypothetical protein [Verrucomicrobiae bacterium]
MRRAGGGMGNGMDRLDLAQGFDLLRHMGRHGPGLSQLLLQLPDLLLILPVCLFQFLDLLALLGDRFF